MAQNRYIVSAALDVILKVMPHTAHRRSLLSALFRKNQQQQKMPRAQQYTSSLVMSGAHGKLNAKHHQTTPKPEIHITVEKKAVLAENIAPKRIPRHSNSASTYVCINARPISTNPGSMEEACEYGVTRGTCFVARRLEVVAAAGLLRISWCVLSVVGFRF